MKQTTFNIPAGCKITIEQHEGKLITTIESKAGDPWKATIPADKETGESWYDKIVTVLSDEMKDPEPEFKDGCVVRSKTGTICIFEKYTDDRLEFSSHYTISETLGNFKQGWISSYFKLSPESLTIIRDALAEVGKQWNAEKNCVEDLKPKRWRADRGEKYWSFGAILKPFVSCENNDGVDKNRYAVGRYFQTEEQAQDAAEKFKQLLNEINP